MNGQKREAFLNLTQIMGAQGQSVTTQAQAMRAQVNWEVAHHVNQNYSTSHLRHFSRMNPPMFFKYKVNIDTQDFIDEVYMILYVMGVNSNEKDN